MRLRQLEYFVAICDAGSLSRAAAELFVAQPSLSQQMRALEKELGGTLLVRLPQGVQPTFAGKALLAEARRILGAVERTTSEIRAITSGAQGELIVLTVRSMASGILSPSVSRWRSTNPEIVLRVDDRNHRRLVEDGLRIGEGDVGVGPRPLDWSGPVLTLGYEELLTVSRFPLPDKWTAEHVAEWEWVLYQPNHGLNEIIEKLCATYEVSPRPSARSPQVEAAMLLAVEGVGVTLVPENVVPAGWSHYARSCQPRIFREVTCYTCDPSTDLALRYIELLTDIELPLRRSEDLPSGAILV